MSKKATAVVSYITLIGWLIAYFAGDRQGAKFHLNQSLDYIFCSAVVNIVLTLLGYVPVISVVAGILSLVCGIFFFVCWILGIIHAAKDEEKELPLIGKIRFLK